MDQLASFHPIVRTWFRRRFAAPTEAQARGWPAILGGRDTLIAAPAGSGKTLAAFLANISRLWGRGLAFGVPVGRWATLPAPEEGDGPPPEEVPEAWATQLLQRYGVVFRSLVQREGLAVPWHDLLRALRRPEAAAEGAGGLLPAAGRRAG